MTKNLGLKQSPNHGEGRGIWDSKSDMIVLHVTEGWFNGSVDWLCNPVSEASSHFVTAHNGSYVQLVDLKDRSWCNGNGPDTINQATNALVKSRKDSNANYYTFSIENEGFSYKDNYGIPTPDQMEAIYEICHKIADFILTYDISWRASRENIIGHCHIWSIKKASCPSPNQAKDFPFDVIINNINKYIDEKLGTSTPIIQVNSPSTVVIQSAELELGSTGSDVEALQAALNSKGFACGIIDGQFGPKTDEAVRLFQSKNNLKADGIVGPKTWAVLNKVNTRPIIQIEDTGSDVEALQAALNNCGFNCGKVDGQFGPKTDEAVRDLQEKLGLVVDGIVGPKTWGMLGI